MHLCGGGPLTANPYPSGAINLTHSEGGAQMYDIPTNERERLDARLRRHEYSAENPHQLLRLSRRAFVVGHNSIPPPPPPITQHEHLSPLARLEHHLQRLIRHRESIHRMPLKLNPVLTRRKLDIKLQRDPAQQVTQLLVRQCLSGAREDAYESIKVSLSPLSTNLFDTNNRSLVSKSKERKGKKRKLTLTKRQKRQRLLPRIHALPPLRPPRLRLLPVPRIALHAPRRHADDRVARDEHAVDGDALRRRLALQALPDARLEAHRLVGDVVDQRHLGADGVVGDGVDAARESGVELGLEGGVDVGVLDEVVERVDGGGAGGVAGG